MGAKIFSLLLLLLTVLSLTSASPHLTNSTEFIRTSCTVTLYPTLCLSSLSRYASAIDNNPIRLAAVAAKVAATKIRSASAHVAVHLRGPVGARDAGALRDCMTNLGNAMDQTKRSVVEIGLLGGTKLSGPEVAWRVSNVQTWMSSVMTDEETCVDGFGDGAGAGAVGGDRVRVDVVGGVGRVKQYSSNALALVNKLVSGP